MLEGGIVPGQVLGSIPTGSTATTFAIDPAPAGLFYVRMHAVNAAGKSPASNEVAVYVSVPSAPTGLLGLVNGSSLTLAWKNTFAGGAPASIVLDVTGTLSGSVPIGLTESFSFAGVPNGTYAFAVRASNAGGTSAASAPVTLTFPGACAGPPETPSNFVVTRTGSTVSVSWDLPASGPAPEGYILKASGAIVGSLALTSRTARGDLPPGTYNLSVLAVNACGQGTETVAQSVTVR